ncbi:MAG: gene transfer agent family protein [Pseudomonadota bacterium]
MVNRRRGEINARLDGQTYTLCLTLGALAELEDAFDVCDLMTLAARFSEGRLSSKDIAKLICCGLRGAGYNLDLDTVLTMQADDGVAGFAQIAQELLIATFGTSDPEAAGALSSSP